MTNAWAYVAAAYVVMVAVVGGMSVTSWQAMRRAERALERERQAP